MTAKMKIMRYIFFLLNLVAVQAIGQNVRLNNIERARDTASVPINIAYPRADTLGVQRYHRDYWTTQNDTLKWYVINTLTGDTTLNQSVRVQTSSGDTSLLSLIIATFTENQGASNTFTTLTFD